MTVKQPPEELRASEERGYELRDADIPNVIVYGFGLLVLVVLIGVVLSVVVYKSLNRMIGRAPPAPQFQVPQEALPPAPRIEAHPWRDMKEFREAEQKQLETYGWIDSARGVVRIPIDRAIDVLAERGLRGQAARGNAAAVPPVSPAAAPEKK